MADNYTAGYTDNGGGKFAPMPAGTQQLVCVDGLFMGHTVEQFQQNPPKLVEKWVYVFQSLDVNPETGKRYEVSQEFNISMYETSKLRKFLEAWRGRPYTDEQARKVPLHAPVGNNAFANIVQRVSKAGRTYSVINTIMPLPTSLPPIEAEGYERAAFWETRKQEYKEKAERFIEDQEREAQRQTAPAGAGATSGDRALAKALADDDNLPF